MKKTKSIYHQDKKLKIHKVISYLLFLLCTPFLTGLGGYIYLRTLDGLIQLTLLGLIGGVLILFAFEQSEICKDLNFNNHMHPLRFSILFQLSVVLVCLYPLLPNTCWPFLFMILGLGFFSSTLIGLCSGSLLISISVILGQADIKIFLLYFLSSVLALILFHKLSEEFHVNLPIFISMTIFFCFQLIFVFLTLKEITFQAIAMPVINLFINIILLIFVLRIYSNRVVHQYRDKYLEINDPEFILLSDLKKENKDEYYKAIHTAYFAEKIARQLQADTQLARAGAYYHRMGKYLEKKKDSGDKKTAKDHILSFCETYEFPPALYQLLLDYHEEKNMIRSKETIIIMLSDAVVTSVLFLFSKDPKVVLDYEQIVELVFKKKMESNSFMDSTITLYELNTMKKIFAGEKLYYDFLR